MLNKWNFEIAKLGTVEPSRFALQALRVTSSGTTETDSRQLVTVTAEADREFSDHERLPFAPDQEFEPFLLDRYDALDIAKAAPGKTASGPEPVVVGAGSLKDRIQIGIRNRDNWSTFDLRKVTGMFPDHERIMPKIEAATLRIPFDLSILVPVLQQMLRFAKGDTKHVMPRAEFYFTTSEQGVRIEARNPQTGQLMTAVVMPREMKK